MKAAILSGTYHDLKFIQGRKCVQIIIELPIEAGQSLVNAFGTPNPASPIWLAIARLENPPQKEALNDKKRKWDDLPPVTQCAIRCTEPEFWEYCGVTGEQDCAEYIRQQCKVISRSGLSMNKEAAQTWAIIDQGFESWKRARP